jgi:uncharacterized protein (TIGR00299 family) protein
VRILYLDCFSGIAGDMLLGALIDLGVDPGSLRRKLSALPLRGYSISTRRTTRQGIGGTKFDVKVGRGHAPRGWKEIREILGGANLEKLVREDALRVFRRLIEAEARVHRLPVARVHLHEVGAVDAIVDIVGSVIALKEILGEGGRLVVSPLYLGRGRVTMEHGTFPVPAPATAELVKGLPVLSGPVEGELVTPTGAAIVSTLASEFGPLPPMTLAGVGYGAGTRQYDNHPNLLRAILGESSETAKTQEEVVLLECNIDDMNPQAYGWLMDLLFERGALEVFYTPVQMKKGRPGTLVSVILPQERFGEVVALLFRESTTIGLRHRLVRRVELAREIVSVKTEYGRVRIKVSSWNGEPVQAQPEFDDCRRAATARGVPLKEVQAAALAAFRAARPSPASVAAPHRKSAARGRRGR